MICWSTAAFIGTGRSGRSSPTKLRTSGPVIGSTLIWYGCSRWKARAFATAVSYSVTGARSCPLAVDEGYHKQVQLAGMDCGHSKARFP